MEDEEEGRRKEEEWEESLEGRKERRIKGHKEGWIKTEESM